MNRKVLVLLGVALLVILVGRSHRHDAAPALPFTAGGWTASQDGGGFVEAADYGGTHLALTLAPGQAAGLDISGDPSKLPAGGGIGLHGTFDDNKSFALTGDGDDGTLHAVIDPGAVGDWLRHMAGGGSLVISFDDQSTAPLAFPLAGAAPTLHALDAAMRQAGPDPWGAPGMLNNPSGAADAVAGVLGLSITSFLLLIAILYFLPAVLAYSRRSAQSGVILVLNLLLGWTVIGWWVLLLVALLSPTRGQVALADGRRW